MTTHRNLIHCSTMRSDAVFINKKILEDLNWRDVGVVLSGREAPGEGEHKCDKIMEDLVMLGLLRHDPYFWLLREVKFGLSQSD